MTHNGRQLSVNPKHQNIHRPLSVCVSAVMFENVSKAARRLTPEAMHSTLKQTCSHWCQAAASFSGGNTRAGGFSVDTSRKNPPDGGSTVGSLFLEAHHPRSQLCSSIQTGPLLCLRDASSFPGKIQNTLVYKFSKIFLLCLVSPSPAPLDVTHL